MNQKESLVQLKQEALFQNQTYKIRMDVFYLQP